MCNQLVEVYAACQCLYYQHAIDRCSLYPNHNIKQRVIPVGYACDKHNPAVNLKSDSDPVTSRSFTVGSVASSTTAVEEDAMGTLLRHMLSFQDLRYLWPQLITLHDSRRKCLRTIARLIKRFADDLGRLATTDSLQDDETTIRRTACRFVRRTRYNLAQRLWEAHAHSSEVTGDDEEYLPGQDVLGSVENKHEDDDDSNFIVSVAERFLFGTDPIQALESSVKGFVDINTKIGDKHEYLPARKIFQTYFMNFMTRFRNPVKQGSHRVTWNCVSTPNF